MGTPSPGISDPGHISSTNLIAAPLTASSFLGVRPAHLKRVPSSDRAHPGALPRIFSERNVFSSNAKSCSKDGEGYASDGEWLPARCALPTSRHKSTFHVKRGRRGGRTGRRVTADGSTSGPRHPGGILRGGDDVLQPETAEAVHNSPADMNPVLRQASMPLLMTPGGSFIASSNVSQEHLGDDLRMQRGSGDIEEGGGGGALLNHTPPQHHHGGSCDGLDLTTTHRQCVPDGANNGNQMLSQMEMGPRSLRPPTRLSGIRSSLAGWWRPKRPAGGPGADSTKRLPGSASQATTLSKGSPSPGGLTEASDRMRGTVPFLLPTASPLIRSRVEPKTFFAVNVPLLWIKCFCHCWWVIP